MSKFNRDGEHVDFPRMVKQWSSLEHGQLVSIDLLCKTQAIEHVVEALREATIGSRNPRRIADQLEQALELFKSELESYCDYNLDKNLKFYRNRLAKKSTLSQDDDFNKLTRLIMSERVDFVADLINKGAHNESR